MKKDRRSFIKMVINAGCVAFIPFGIWHRLCWGKTKSGGSLCNERIGTEILDSSGEEFDQDVPNVLWSLFQAINQAWGDSSETDSFKLQWEEFVDLRINNNPSYKGEYANATIVLRELFQKYGQEGAYARLLFNSELSDDDTRLAHVKKYVVDEFIKVHLTLGGFKHYGARNYNSFFGGPRNTTPPPYRTIGE